MASVECPWENSGHGKKRSTEELCGGWFGLLLVHC